MTDRSETVDSMARLLESCRNNCISSGPLLLEADADALQLMVSTSSNWPDFIDLPPIYRQTLHELFRQSGTKVFIKESDEIKLIEEMIAAAKQNQHSTGGLYAALTKYGAKTLPASLSMISIVMSVKLIFRGREDVGDALKAVENFVSPLDGKFMARHLHRIAGELIHFVQQSSAGAGQ